MRWIQYLVVLAMLLNISSADAQRPRRQKGTTPGSGKKVGNAGKRRGKQASNQGPIGDSNPLPIGESGVAWYTTWSTGVAEARRSNRPIFFMSAATTCSGVPGVF